MIWLIGASGMLGASVALLLKKNKIPFVGTSSDVDARDYKKLREFAEKWESDNYLSARQKGLLSRFNWIVNCSGYTAVEKAESEKEAARALNVTAASNIARVARELGAKMIHISSDYVFDGKASSPYTEDSRKNPLGVYGQTKSAGEDEIQKMMTQYFIIRTSWLYGRGRPNFVKDNGPAYEFKGIDKSRERPIRLADKRGRLGRSGFAYNKERRQGGNEHFQQGSRSVRHIQFFQRGANVLV